MRRGIDNWDLKDKESRSAKIGGWGNHWIEARELPDMIGMYQGELRLLRRPDVEKGYPTLYVRLFSVAEERFKVPIRKILGLTYPWEDYLGFSGDQVERVIQAACTTHGISRMDFINAVREQVEWEVRNAKSELKRRAEALGRAGLLVAMPDLRWLQAASRYEKTLVNQFYRDLTQLQRLQAARQGVPVPRPYRSTSTLMGMLIRDHGIRHGGQLVDTRT